LQTSSPRPSTTTVAAARDALLPLHDKKLLAKLLDRQIKRDERAGDEV
jgi:hypothetical protein